MTSSSCAHYVLVIALLLFSALFLLLHFFQRNDNLSFEEKRQLMYKQRGYTWPISEYIPNTKGWKDLYDRRLRQVSEIKRDLERYEGYAQTIGAALVQPNFTEYGFGLARAPDDLMEALRQGIQDGLANGIPREEAQIRVIEGENRPWFIDRPDLTERVLRELQHYPETWTGMELTPVIAYGFRLYRNNSKLNMHLDRADTHIISFILHIDSSDDAEPWPVMIEDYLGHTHEIILTSGDMLLYESSKCLHGRPRKFNGSWYTSVFVHYYPKFYWTDRKFSDSNEKAYAVPPHWKEKPKSSDEIPLRMIGTSMKEPTCPHEWCDTTTSTKWSGPGEEGFWIAPTGERFPFEPKELVCEDWDSRCPDWASLKGVDCKSNFPFMLSHCKKSCGACTSKHYWKSIYEF